MVPVRDPRPGVAVAATRCDFDPSAFRGRQSACPVRDTAKRYPSPNRCLPWANGDQATHGSNLLWIAELNVRAPLGIVKEMLVLGSLLDRSRVVVVSSLPFLVQVCCLLQPLRDRCRLAVLARSGNRVDEVRGRDGRDGEVEAGLASPVSLPHEDLSSSASTCTPIPEQLGILPRRTPRLRDHRGVRGSRRRTTACCALLMAGPAGPYERSAV